MKDDELIALAVSAGVCAWAAILAWHWGGW